MFLSTSHCTVIFLLPCAFEMKKLIRKLCRISHSVPNSIPLNQSNSSLTPPATKCLAYEYVPAGHLPVHVGLEKAERFVVNAELLHHPIFIELLNISAQEYGYDQVGILKIPVHVLVFKRVLESLYLGQKQYSCLDEIVHSVVSSC